MADNAPYSIDASALWGPDGDGGLTAAPLVYNGEERGDAVLPDGGGERGVADGRIHDDVARLTEAITANNAGLLRRADLDAVRAELEGAFTQQLAVTLYELIGVCNVRFAAAEEHINGKVTAAVEAQTRFLTKSLEGAFDATVEVAESVRTQLAAARQELLEPEERSASFQRELRHEMGRLADLVERQSAELAALREQLSELQDEMESRRPRGLSVQDL